MRGSSSPAPAFDPVWLDELDDLATRLRSRTPRLVDLYLERRLEVAVVPDHGNVVVRELRSEGVAARWSSKIRTVMAARNGISHAVVRDLLGQAYEHVQVPAPRRGVAAELAPPAGWLHWAEGCARTAGGSLLELRLLERRAAVVAGGRWRNVVTPPLVHARRLSPPAANLLAVWDHPALGRWMGELLEGSPERRWAPRPGTVLPVLFTAGSGGVLIHELVGHLVESDLVQEGGSPMAPLLGAVIGPPGLTVIDDPTRQDLPGAFSCDDEGISAQPEIIVGEGALRGWISDLHGSRTLGCKPGRGRRASWELPPVSRMSNLIVPPGTSDPEAMEHGLGDGLVVTRTGGASVDPATGLAVILVERGWELRDGRRRRSLAPCRLTAPAMRTLATLDPAIGDDPQPGWRLGWCVKDGLAVPTGMETPTLLAHELHVL